MPGREVEVPLAHEMVFDAAGEQGDIVGEVGMKDANGKASLRAQGARVKVGTIIQRLGSLENSFLRLFGNGSGSLRPVDYEGNRCRGKI